jgi:hypothetical protein
MKRLFLLLILLFSLHLTAQVAPHSATLAWLASPTPNVHYKVYSVQIATTACPPAIAASGYVAIAQDVNALTYVDTAVLGSKSYCYYVTAFAPTLGESAPSNTTLAVVPPDRALPPGTLSIPQMAMNTSGSSTEVAFAYTGNPAVLYSWTLTGDKTFLERGSGYGPASADLFFKRQKSAKLTVCDVAIGHCISRTVVN